MTDQVPAGVVVHQPDCAVLGQLLGRLDTGRRVFIFVNGPLGDEARELVTRRPVARVIWSEHNVGLGAGLNSVVDAAISESFSHIMLFDQDSEPSADLPEQLLARWTAETAKGVRLAVVGPMLVPPEQGHYRQMRYYWRSHRHGGPIAPVHFAPTSGSLIWLVPFLAIGPFREDFFIGGIDVEWGFRAWSRGYGSVVARDLMMVHRWGEAASTAAARTPQILRHSSLRQYYYIRNAVYSLSLPFIPLSWRLRYALGLCSQIGYLVLFGRGLRHRGIAMFAALRDGAFGRLGPVTSDLSVEILQ